MSNDRMKTLSKFLSLVLRHKPDILDLHMDMEGFVNVKELLAKIRQKKTFSWVSFDDIKLLVETDGKHRFELIERGGEYFIRARYGHSKSLKVKIRYTPMTGIKYLYHGTNAKVLPWILKEGLRPMNRKYVHLSPTPEDALIVARRRRGKPVILLIDAESFMKDGGVIYKATDKVYLAEYIPPKYIRIYKYGVG